MSTLRIAPFGALAASLTVSAQDQTSEVRVLSVCEALQGAKDFAGKIVAVRGIEVATGEGVWLDGGDCKIVIGGRQWQSTIWLEMSKSAVESAGFNFDDLGKSLNAWTPRQKKAPFHRERDAIRTTYIGRFEAPFDSVTAGFGHMNAAPAQIIVRNAKDMVVVYRRAPTPKP